MGKGDSDGLPSSAITALAVVGVWGGILLLRLCAYSCKKARENHSSAGYRREPLDDQDHDEGPIFVVRPSGYTVRESRAAVAARSAAQPRMEEIRTTR